MENGFSHVLDALPGFAWTALPNGAVEFLNHRCCQYTGLSSDEVCGKGWHVAVYPRNLPEFLQRWHSILASSRGGEMEARMRHRDGEYRWFRISANPMRGDSGEIIRWIAVNTELGIAKGATR